MITFCYYCKILELRRKWPLKIAGTTCDEKNKKNKDDIRKLSPIYNNGQGTFLNG